MPTPAVPWPPAAPMASMSNAPISGAGSPARCAAPSPRGRRGTYATAGRRAPTPCPPSTWPWLTAPVERCGRPPWRLPTGLPGTPASAQHRRAPKRCPAVAAPTPGTPDSAGFRARGGASRVRPLGPGARGSVVPAHAIATSLRVAASHLAGGLQGPLPMGPVEGGGSRHLRTTCTKVCVVPGVRA